MERRLPFKENYRLLFPCSVYVPGVVTLGRGSPYLPGRVTLEGGLTFYHIKGQGRVTLLRGLRFRLSDYCRIRAVSKQGFARLSLLVEVALG